MIPLEKYIERHMDWSLQTFGPGHRHNGIVDHIKKELAEIDAAPGDLDEWVDVIILAIDGAWRSGHSPDAICDALERIQMRNFARQWPDWRTAKPDKAIEHVRG